MFETHRASQFKKYNEARNFFAANPERLEAVERLCMETLSRFVSENHDEIKRDYDEASFLYPFWQNYPPDDRGRQPTGEQIPWLEVGEQVFGPKLSRFLAKNFTVRDSGIPSGPDDRFVLSGAKIKKALEMTDSVWLFVDIKSVGPRDDCDHAVMSHNQISGNGKWSEKEFGVVNDVMTARGKRVSHPFHCAIPPLFVLSDGTVAPVAHFVIKPVYATLDGERGQRGQPLVRVSLASIPNGILLAENPGYLNTFPELLFPGKDDKEKNPKKARARVSFELLRRIAAWRFEDISFE